MIIIEILIEHLHGIIHSYLLLLQRDIWINALKILKYLNYNLYELLNNYTTQKYTRSLEKVY